MKHLALAAIAVVVLGNGLARAQEQPPDPALRIRERLAATRITLDFTGARLADVIAYFQEYSGLNFHLEAGDEGTARITIKVKDVSMKAALRLILNPRDLRCVLRNGAIVITTKDRIGSRMVTRVYDIREIMLPLRDFAGPKMELQPPGCGLIGCMWLPMDVDPTPPLAMEFFVDLIKTCISDPSWEGDASISQVGGLLVVSQASAVHEEIGRLLERLRLYR